MAEPSREQLKGDSVRLAGKRMTAVVERLRPGCLLCTTWGFEDGELFDLTVTEIEAEIKRSGPVTIFADSSQHTGMTTEARESWMRWSKASLESIRSSHVLVSSRLLDMTMSLILLFAGGRRMRTYSDSQTFVRAIAAEVPGFARLPVYSAQVQARAISPQSR